MVGFHLHALAQEAPPKPPTPNPFDAWVHLGTDGTVTLVLAKSEMGQGIYTALPMILAEELDVAWDSVKVEQAPTRPAWYNHGTGGSSSTRTSYAPLRQAGAAARAMLVKAAAEQWKVDPASLKTDKGTVLGPAGQRAPYGSLVEAAAKLPIPDLERVPLKDPATFGIIGTSVPRVDIPPKTNGSARFGIDVRLPGRLYAVVARPPVYGGAVKKYDAAKAKAIKGVRRIVELPKVDTDGAFTRGGIAVVADGTYAAMQGRDALQIEWDGGPSAAISNESLRKDFEALIAKGGEALAVEPASGRVRDRAAQPSPGLWRWSMYLAGGRAARGSVGSIGRGCTVRGKTRRSPP